MATESRTAEAEGSFGSKALGAVKTKGLKYSAVSIFNVLFGQTLIVVFNWANLGHSTANALAVMISAVPAYYLSRTWVWGKRGKSELRREVIPFWIFVAVGLLISTAGVALMSTAWKNSTGNEMPNIMINIINLGSFGVLWLIRFFWMDRVFHLDTHHQHGPLDVLLDEDEPVD